MELFSETWQYLLDADNWTGAEGLVARLLEQLLLTATALAAAMLLGLPLALWLGHLGKGGFLAVNISNVGRAVPTFALLAILVAADWPGSATASRTTPTCASSPWGEMTCSRAWIPKRSDPIWRRSSPR